MPNSLTQDLKQHPLSAAFPPMQTDEFDKLVENIRGNGQQEPGTVYEGKVLDGWHRYRACNILGITFDMRPLPAGMLPETWVIAKNLERRHLSKQQRAVAVAKVTEHKWRSPGEKDSQKKPAVSERELAKLSGTSVSTIQTAKKAVREGKEKQVLAGEKTIFHKKRKMPNETPPALLKAREEIIELKERLRASNEREIGLCDRLEAYMNVYDSNNSESNPEAVQKRQAEIREVQALRQADNQQKARIQSLIAENNALKAENTMLKRKLGS